MGLLDDYQKMVEEDEKNLNNNAPADGIEMTEEEMKEYEKRLNEMRDEMKNDENYTFEMVKPLEKVNENSLKTEYVKVTPMVKKAYCPECGKEIVSNAPTMFNPFTLEKNNPYKCECGWKADLEYSYPRVVFVTDNGTQIEAYAK